jgi:transcription initiation factor TFIIB
LIYQGTETKQITAEKYPVAQTTASLYIVCIMNGEKISQKKFSVKSGVSDVTIRNRAI